MHDEHGLGGEIDHAAIADRCARDAWGILARPDRSHDDIRELVLLAHAAQWHRTRSRDCTDEARATGWWMISRAQALAGCGTAAREAADAMAATPLGDCPFLNGFAAEASARAAWMLGDAARFETDLRAARSFPARIDNAFERSLLETDLAELAGRATADAHRS